MFHDRSRIVVTTGRKIAMQKIQEIFACRIWNPGPWNSQLIQLRESGIPLKSGIQSPSSTYKESEIQYLKSEILRVESRIQETLGASTKKNEYYTLYSLSSHWLSDYS